MKKSIALLLVLLLTLPGMSLAEEAYFPEDVFEPEFQVSANPDGASRLRVAVNCDPSVFEVMSHAYVNRNGGLSYAMDIHDGILTGLKFRIRPFTAPGTYRIDLTVLSATDKNRPPLPIDRIRIEPLTVTVRSRNGEETPVFHPGDRVMAKFTVVKNDSSAVFATMRLQYDENVFHLEPSNIIVEGSRSFDFSGANEEPVWKGTYQWVAFTVLPTAAEGTYQIAAETQIALARGNRRQEASSFSVEPFTGRLAAGNGTAPN